MLIMAIILIPLCILLGVMFHMIFSGALSLFAASLFLQQNHNVLFILVLLGTFTIISLIKYNLAGNMVNGLIEIESMKKKPQ